MRTRVQSLTFQVELTLNREREMGKKKNGKKNEEEQDRNK